VLQAPQFARSVLRSRHVPSQLRSVAAHEVAHTPFEQT
jgi:hypothetical protein